MPRIDPCDNSGGVNPHSVHSIHALVVWLSQYLVYRSLSVYFPVDGGHAQWDRLSLTCTNIEKIECVGSWIREEFVTLGSMEAMEMPEDV